jgi:hypothetical protein
LRVSVPNLVNTKGPPLYRFREGPPYLLGQK